jgi:DNA-binding PadR family transcriptional regulator
MISNLEASVLGLISEGFRYGYELDKTIEERNMRQWTDIAYSSIYYVLKRLEQKGFITSETEKVNGRSRKLYTITPKGETEIQEKVLEIISNYNPLTDPFDLGIGFLGRVDHNEAIQGLVKYLESIDKRKQHYEKRLEAIENSDWPFYIKGLVTRHLAMLSTEREWIETFIKDLEAVHKAKVE